MSAPLLFSAAGPWWLDNLLGLQFQWLLAAALSVALGLVFYRRLTAWLLPLIALPGLLNMAPFYLPSDVQSATTPELKIGQLNIRYHNPHAARIFASLVEDDFDLLAISEIADHRVGELAQLSAHYPYSLGSNSLQGYSQGHVLLSKWPLQNAIIHDLGYAGGKIIEARLALPHLDEPVRILALHPGAPRSNQLWRMRNATLSFVADLVADSDLAHQIVVGDLNVSPWSPVFKRLLKRAELINTGVGFGYHPTWAQFNQNAVSRWLSGAYIDHCLTTTAFALRGKQTRVVPGSDHLLVITELDPL